jgi:hypothetical protein
MAAGTTSLVAVLRDAVLRRAPQDEVRRCKLHPIRSDQFHEIDPLADDVVTAIVEGFGRDESHRIVSEEGDCDAHVMYADEAAAGAAAQDAVGQNPARRHQEDRRRRPPDHARQQVAPSAMRRRISTSKCALKIARVAILVSTAAMLGDRYCVMNRIASGSTGATQ